MLKVPPPPRLKILLLVVVGNGFDYELDGARDVIVDSEAVDVTEEPDAIAGDGEARKDAVLMLSRNPTANTES